MKTRKIISILLVAIMIASMFAVSSFAANMDECYNGAPVYGQFVPDPATAAKIAEKERATEISRSGITKTYLLAIQQFPQEESTWCGYAAMESVLEYKGYSVTQEELKKSDICKDWNSLPWYWNNGNKASDFPAVEMLNFYTGSRWEYEPYPYGAAGATKITADKLYSKVDYTVEREYGVLCAGESHFQEASYLPNYPSFTVNHWVVIRGYGDYGAELYVVDPAKSDKVSWSDKITANYVVPTTTMAAYASYRGIIY